MIGLVLFLASVLVCPGGRVGAGVPVVLRAPFVMICGWLLVPFVVAIGAGVSVALVTPFMMMEDG